MPKTNSTEQDLVNEERRQERENKQKKEQS